MVTIVVERTGPGEWRYGTEGDSGIRWDGTVTELGGGGREATGPDHLVAIVLLLIRQDSDASVIHYDPRAVWEAARRLMRAEHEARRQASAPGGRPWQRATSGLAKAPGRTLGEMARSGRMGR